MISTDLLRKLDVVTPRYTSYPTVPEWSEAFGPADHQAALRRAGETPEAPLSLYVHLPFCRELCSYCGCNVVVTRDQGRVERYLEALDHEIAHVAGLLGDRRRVARLHLGGGTPTFLDERQLTRLWQTLNAHFRLDPDAEVALEIDPTVTSREQLDLLGGFGFNRISMGVQDFDPDVQRAVNRIQSFEDTAAAVEHARRVGFASINLDLIYGLPCQTVASFQRTMSQVVALRPDRVAVFSFAFVPALRPNQRRLVLADLPSSEQKHYLSAVADAELSGAGFRAIGIDHYARHSDELAVAAEHGTLWRDFQGYTTRRANATVAVGASAISDLGFAYAQNVHALGDYQQAVGGEATPTSRGKWLSDDDQRRREVITQLLCNGSAALGADGYFAAELEALAPLVQDGLVTPTASAAGVGLELSTSGRRFARNVAMVFDAYLRREGAIRSFSRAI